MVDREWASKKGWVTGWLTSSSICWNFCEYNINNDIPLPSCASWRSDRRPVGCPKMHPDEWRVDRAGECPNMHLHSGDECELRAKNSFARPRSLWSRCSSSRVCLSEIKVKYSIKDIDKDNNKRTWANPGCSWYWCLVGVSSTDAALVVLAPQSNDLHLDRSHRASMRPVIEVRSIHPPPCCYCCLHSDLFVHDMHTLSAFLLRYCCCLNKTRFVQDDDDEEQVV